MASLPLQAAAAALVPDRKGYAFDQPRTLVQQRLFGLAHGVTLLAATCLADGSWTKGRDALLGAYAEWDKVQTSTIEEIQHDLARYYFNGQAAEAGWNDIAAATGLRLGLDLKPGSIELVAACDSLPETLKKPRYDLRQQYRLQQFASRLAAATTTEAYAQVCQSTLPQTAAAELNEGMRHWREAYEAAVAESRTALGQQWDDAQLEVSLGTWLAQADDKGQRAAKSNAVADGNRPSCATLAAWLLTKQADPDAEFNSRP